MDWVKAHNHQSGFREILAERFQSFQMARLNFFNGLHFYGHTCFTYHGIDFQARVSTPKG